jgi:hypothetical protein
MNHSLPPDLVLALRAGALDADAASRLRAVLRREGWPDVEGLALDDPSACAVLLEVLEDAPRSRVGERLAAALVRAAGEVELAAPVVRSVGGPVSALGPALEAALSARVEVVDGVMQALAADGLVERPLPLAEAVRQEAGEVDVMAIVAARLGLPARARPRRVARRPPSLAQALRASAGVIDLADLVMAAVAPAAPVDEDMWLSAMLDRELDGPEQERVVARLMADRKAGVRMTRLADAGRGLREAVLLARGAEVQLWPRVAAAIGVADAEAVPGWRGEALAEAVRRAAGAVDVAPEVMAAVRSDLAEVEVPEPANRRSWSAAVALAAALLLLAVLPRWLAPAPEEGFREVPAQFATAGEVNVDEIRSGPNATVFVEVPTGDEAPLIIWVDDGGAP